MKLPSWRAARAKTRTSADIAAEIDQHRSMLGEATAALAALDATRRDVLLGDDVAPIRDHEAKAAELRIGVARIEARLDALGEQAAEIAAVETLAALDERRTVIEARSAEAAAWLRDTYPALAQEIVDALHSLQEVEREVLAINSAMVEVGRDVPELPGVQARLGIFLGGAGLDAGAPLASGSATSLGGSVRLPELVGGVRAPGWTPRLWS